jgi:hypothetical protein
MANDIPTHDFSVDKLVQEILTSILAEKEEFDSDIVQLIKDHLGEKRIHLPRLQYQAGIAGWQYLGLQ